MRGKLTVIVPGGAGRARFTAVLRAAEEDTEIRRLGGLTGPLSGERLLFAVSLDEGGVNEGLPALLGYLRTHPGCLDGCVGGVLVDGPGELYTKSVGREIVFAANLAGCAFPGRSLVEGVGNLANLRVQADNARCSLEDAYRLAARDLTGRILAFAPPRRERPKILALHASSRVTSNTLSLWGAVRKQLEERCAVREIGLRSGTLVDCAACSYTTCLHYGEREECFYGGVMVEEVYPAIREADAVVMLCPNYNDALPANLTAAVNRLTALYRAAPFTGQAVFAIVVSGYSGGDIVAAQVISALHMNKGFWLPPHFCLLETANDPGSAARLPGIQERLSAFAGGILFHLTGG